MEKSYDLEIIGFWGLLMPKKGLVKVHLVTPENLVVIGYQSLSLYSLFMC